MPLLVVFSLVSSAGYVINDLINRQEDQKHPRKRRRPIASGEVTTKAALLTVGGLYAVSFALSFMAYGAGMATLSTLAYVGLNWAYTFLLRRVVIIDVFAISLGFVLRVMAGAYAVQVAPSEWLMVLTYLLALLLGVGKRRGEVRVMDKSHIEVGVTRQVLRWYEGERSSLLVWIIAVITTIVYGMYCIQAQGGFPFLFTLIPVAVAIYSYVRRAERSDEVEVPEVMIYRPSMMLAAVLCWGVMVVWLLSVK